MSARSSFDRTSLGFAYLQTFWVVHGSRHASPNTISQHSLPGNAAENLLGAVPYSLTEPASRPALETYVLVNSTLPYTYQRASMCVLPGARDWKHARQWAAVLTPTVAGTVASFLDSGMIEVPRASRSVHVPRPVVMSRTRPCRLASCPLPWSGLYYRLHAYMSSVRVWTRLAFLAELSSTAWLPRWPCVLP